MGVLSGPILSVMNTRWGPYGQRSKDWGFSGKRLVFQCLSWARCCATAGLKVCVTMPGLEFNFFFCFEMLFLLSLEGNTESILQSGILQVGTWIQIRKTVLLPLQGVDSLQFVQLWKQCSVFDLRQHMTLMIFNEDRDLRKNRIFFLNLILFVVQVWNKWLSSSAEFRVVGI